MLSVRGLGFEAQVDGCVHGCMICRFAKHFMGSSRIASRDPEHSSVQVEFCKTRNHE